MSFIQNATNELGSPIDLLFQRPGSDKRVMPKQLVLSSSVFFTFVDPVSLEEIQLLQADSISKTKKFSERKNFKPFGHSTNVVLIDDNGWDIRITGKKTDSILSYLIYLQELSLNGNSNISPTFNTSDNGAQVAGMKFELQIKEQINYLPNSKGVPSAIEEYLYTDVTIIGYEEQIEGNNGTVSFTLSCYAGNRIVITNPTELNSPLNDIVTNIMNDLLSRNKQ